jgi:hypothetical protein
MKFWIEDSMIKPNLDDPFVLLFHYLGYLIVQDAVKKICKMAVASEM